MENLYKLLNINLQLFGDGVGTAASSGSSDGADAETAGVSGADPQSQSGVESPAAGEKEVETITPEEEFEQLIKSEKFRDIYSKKMQTTVHQRLKGSQATKAQLKSAQAILATVAQRYQVDPNDFDALQRAVNDDDSYLEDEALKRNVTVDQVRVERENAALRRQLQDEAAQKTYDKWVSDGENLKAIYPDFDMDSELEDPQFQNLLRSGIDVRTAFEVLHLDDIRGASMAYAAQKTKENVAKSIASGNNRPNERGVSGGGAVNTRARIEAMSDAQINALCDRVMRGESVDL